ncbi:hypothetical protein [Schaalia sp. Marseille-Q2122]|uniref:hypothetical protein n=1 Tax=Schaalia sp. Marseille-Q2122 TaxID=2736604 RepID=UPI00158EA06B|nr:hypothetical protein [Schaalia sp. Marseille-Q2122]
MSVSQVKANKKPWYKVWWVWVIILIVLAGIGGAGKDKASQEGIKPTQVTSDQNSQSAAEAAEQDADVQGQSAVEEPMREPTPEERLEAVFPKDDARKALVVAASNSSASDVFAEDGNTYDPSKFHRYGEKRGHYLLDKGEAEFQWIDDSTWQLRDLPLDAYEDGLLKITEYWVSGKVTWNGSDYVITDITMRFSTPTAAPGYDKGPFDLLVRNGDPVLTVSPDMIK